MSHFDDDQTELHTTNPDNGHRDSFDDDQTELHTTNPDNGHRDSFDDDQTELHTTNPDDRPGAAPARTRVSRDRKDSTGQRGAKPRNQRTTSVRERREPGRPRANPNRGPGTRSVASAPTPPSRSAVSLRDRVPEVVTPWHPPERPRTAEYTAPEVAVPVPWKAGIGVLAASLVVTAGAWFVLVRDTDSDESDDVPAAVIDAQPADEAEAGDDED